MSIQESNEKELRFGFGKNWLDFLSKVEEKTFVKAVNSIKESLEVENLNDKTFVDIGCGSGLFSYAAFTLGAKKVISFDYDENSISATRKMWEKVGKPANWEVIRGSALDSTFLDSLGKFDIVYSWGVLHHTGSMWDAIAKTLKMVDAEGKYCIAIYNKIEGRFGTSLWHKIKKRYNKGNILTKKIIEYLYILFYFIFLPLTNFKNPLNTMKNYGSSRGMNWRVDVTDWVGGFPYEYASESEIFNFIKKEAPSFQLTYLKSTSGTGCNTFVFKNK